MKRCSASPISKGTQHTELSLHTPHKDRKPVLAQTEKLGPLGTYSDASKKKMLTAIWSRNFISDYTHQRTDASTLTPMDHYAQQPRHAAMEMSTDWMNTKCWGRCLAKPPDHRHQLGYLLSRWARLASCSHWCTLGSSRGGLRWVPGSPTGTAGNGRSGASEPAFYSWSTAHLHPHKRQLLSLT